MNIMILGNSTAAIAAAEAIRKHDTESDICIVSSEPHHTYGRPLISYLLCGKMDTERMRYRPADFYEKHHIEIRLGVSATAIDAAAKRVTLDDGESLPFDKLLVATGSRPIIPAIPGLEAVKRQYTFTTLADAEALRHVVRKNTRVLILGAGLIGLKCAEGLHAITKQITLVDMAPQIMPNVLSAQAADILQAHIQAQGLALILNDAAISFTEKTARLASGKVIPFDVLVVAVGVRPNVELVAQAGGEAKQGIVTDVFGRTSLPDVYAAGDCTQSTDLCSETQRVMALLPNAYIQGECAGTHIVGGSPNAPRLMPMNAVSLWGKHIVSAGLLEGEIDTERTDDGLRVFARCDNRLRGFLLVGDVARSGIYTALIRDQTPLSSVDYPLLRKRPSLAAFGLQERQKMLGGEGA